MFVIVTKILLLYDFSFSLVIPFLVMLLVFYMKERKGGWMDGWMAG